MARHKLLSSLQELQIELSEAWEMNHFYKLGNLVAYHKHRSFGLDKTELNHFVGGLSVIYLFSVFEDYFPQRLWKDFIDPKSEQILKAYKHVRNSVAHGHGGQRIEPKTKTSQDEYDAFDTVIEEQMFNPNGVIMYYSHNNTFRIDPTIGVYMKNFMEEIVRNSIERMTTGSIK